MQRAFLSILSTLFIATLGCLIPRSVAAQVSPDGTTATTVNQNRNNFVIEQGDRVGDNLFHSFTEFSVPALGSAVFNNAADIANIFSRVTGSSISNIDGLLGANGAANLYLINPNGIIFGENARLNLGGSFFASTADSLLFEGDTEFSAVNPQALPLLEISIPIGARFRDNPGDIVNRSIVQNNEEEVGLEVLSGKNITFLGGNLDFESGHLTAKGGNIELGGLSQAGTIVINQDEILNFSEDLDRADISLSNASDINVISSGGGNININAHNLNLEDGEIRAGIEPDSALSNALGEDINIDATGNISLNNSTIENRQKGIGNSGNLIIAADSLSLNNGSNIITATDGQGNAGLIDINITEDIIVDGGNIDSGIFSQVGSGADGDSGAITISATNLDLTSGGRINSLTFGNGNSGLININVTEDIGIVGIVGSNMAAPLSSVGSVVIGNANGDSGTITISATNLDLISGGRIDSLTFGNGNSGLVEVAATENITIDGEDSPRIPSFISSGVGSMAEGNSPGIILSTNNLTVNNGGQVDATTEGQGDSGLIDITATGDIVIDGEGMNGINPSGIASNVDVGAEGNSQGIIISTHNLTLSNGGRLIAATSGRGNSGSVEVVATGDITIDGEGNSDNTLSGLFNQVMVGAEGNSQEIVISTNNLNVANGGSISASTFGQGNAGSISITAIGDIAINGENVDGVPSGVNSRVNVDAVGNAGGINISTTDLNLTAGGGVDASTAGQGNAGAVSVIATGDIIVNEGDVSSQVSGRGEGDSGGIAISTTNLSLINGGRVDASAIGIGSSGKIDVTAKDNIFVEGEDSRGFPSRIVSGVDSIGDSGGIAISTTNLSLINGGQVNASTTASGNAGSLTIDASGSIFISGKIERFRSGISANAINGFGNASNINIATEQLTISNNGIIEASNFDISERFSSEGFFSGIGEPGNITIKAGSIELANQANINTATQSETGNTANINLQVAEDIILKNSSLISARAVGDASGGNITIDANNGLVLAFPNNNDIIANAAQGNGGNISIDTQAIFGLEERSSTPFNQSNDIDASSEFGLQGDFSLNTPNFDPTTGLINLPASVGDASDQISQNPCQQGVGSQFLVTGKGGLPPNPTENLESDRITVDLVEPLSREEETGRQGEEAREEDIITARVPAMGWVFNEKGEVTLTAYSNTDTKIERSPQHHTTCQSNLAP